MKKIFLLTLLVITFILSGCTQAAVNNLEISMLNIGQGDAILIRTKDQTILIDTASVANREQFVRELEKFSVTKIDKLILTHPHIDHIGNARLLINPTEKDIEDYPYVKNISIVEVYDNDVAYTSGAYKNYLKTVTKKGNRHTLKVGDTLDFGGGVTFKVLFPTAEYVEQINSGKFDSKVDRLYRMNNSSIVGKLTYKNFSMLFTGDCEKEAEAKILASNADLKCNILKSGHHGNQSSSTKKFVAAVNPEYVLISAGDKGKDPNITNNLKVHPRIKPLRNYIAQGINTKNILCTRFNGSITVTTDGKSFSVKPEVEKDWVEEWIAKKLAAGFKN